MLLQGHWRTFGGWQFPHSKPTICPTVFLLCLKPRSNGKRGLIKTHKSVICFASVHFTSASATYAFCSKPCPSATWININYHYQRTVTKIMAASTSCSCFFHFITLCYENQNYTMLTYTIKFQNQNYTTLTYFETLLCTLLTDCLLCGNLAAHFFIKI